MGAWGTALYSNDTACDIRGEYVDLLRRGNTNEEVTQKLISDNQEIMGDSEEEPLFWFALADTQWNNGRLLPEVREKALWFLENGEEDQRWVEAGSKMASAWRSTLQKLKEKLLSPQPPEKKLPQYRLYHCKWKHGDVYAYRFYTEYSKEAGFYNQMILLRKVSERYNWPGHVVPVVHVYKWVGRTLPSLDNISKLELLPMIERNRGNKEAEPVYDLEITETSDRAIPKDQLTYLGNLPGEDLRYEVSKSFDGTFQEAGWEASPICKKIEKVIIDLLIKYQVSINDYL